MKNIKRRKILILFLILSIGTLFPISCSKDSSNPTTPTIIEPATGLTCSNGYWYDWLCYPMQFLQNWGLGTTEQEYFHNDSYSWYIDQANTGQYSENNCGPASTTMAAKWFDETFNKTAEDARNMYFRDGGWWYTNDIINYLNDYSIPNHVRQFENSEQIVELLRQGYIIILCINTSYIRRGYSNEERVDRFYDYADGHFLIVKGARRVDRYLFFEVYDPNNWHALYADSSEKGENRHYREEDITQAISNWWNYIIVIGSISNIEKGLYRVDPDTIKHMWG